MDEEVKHTSKSPSPYFPISFLKFPGLRLTITTSYGYCFSYYLLLISLAIKITSSVSGGKLIWMRLPKVLSDAGTVALMRILMKT